jgi:hypothetical protein
MPVLLKKERGNVLISRKRASDERGDVSINRGYTLHDRLYRGRRSMAVILAVEYAEMGMSI